MPAAEVKFPVYRKYKNNKSYFKIISETRFDELQVIGSRIRLKSTEAKLYPEKMFIRDLLIDYLERAVEITEKEYEEVLKRTNTLL